MKIIIASQNPVKYRAVENAYRVQFPGIPLHLQTVTVESGVSDQPMSDAETRRGACNRVIQARQLVADADYWVGLEGGLEWVDRNLLASAWMAVSDRQGKMSTARSPTLPLPPQVRRLVRQGMELGDANDLVFETRNSKQGGGAFGLLTAGKMTREDVYTQTLVLALIPFVNPLYTA